MGRRLPDIRRRRPIREPRSRFVIFCEGRNTEPAYFLAIGQRFRNALISIETVGGAGAPSTIADKAIEYIREGRNDRRWRLGAYERGDRVWAVFDRDDHPHFDEAVEKCHRFNVGVARSDPCFEVWLLLHLQDFDKLDGRLGVQQALRKLRPEYDPDGSKTLDANSLVDLIETAELRAMRQLARREREGVPFGRPSTTAGALTTEIREAALRSV